MKVIKRTLFPHYFRSTHMALFIFMEIEGRSIDLQIVYIRKEKGR